MWVRGTRAEANPEHGEKTVNWREESELMSSRPPPRLSPTSMRTYETCPYAFKLRYLDRVRTPDTAARVLGRAIHRVIEANYRHKRRRRSDLPVEQALDIFDEVWDGSIHEVADSEPEELEDLREQGYDLVEFYLVEVAPSIRPLLIEERFSFTLPQVEAPIVGYVDLIDQEGRVIDHKTAAAPFPEDYLEHDIQLMTYSLGYATLRFGARWRPGQLPLIGMLPPVVVDVLIKGEPIAHQRLELQYDESHVEEYLARANAVAVGVRTGHYPPFWQVRDPNPDTCRRCDFNAICSYRLAPAEEETLPEDPGDGETDG